MNCMDIRTLLNQFNEEKIIGKCSDNSRRGEYLQMTENIDFIAFYCGSTYVSLDVTMSMQKYIVDNLITNIVDNKEYDQPKYLRQLKQFWNTHTYPCQTYHSYGVRFVTISKYNTNSKSNINHIGKLSLGLYLPYLQELIGIGNYSHNTS